MTSRWNRCLVVVAMAMTMVGWSCGRSSGNVEPPSTGGPLVRVEPLEVPGPAGRVAPELRADGDGVLVSWLRLVEDGHVLEMTRWTDAGWEATREVVRSEGIFANWADRPGVVRAPDRSLVAWWPEKLGEGTYAYGLQLARSEDEGQTWIRLGLLHDDASETEHGFAAWIEEGEGLRAFWLDGRATADGGAMQLRTAMVGPEGPEASELLDESVCDCCSLDATRGEETTIVVYRDRSPEEVRDIGWVASRDGGGWTAPRTLWPDRWTIHGCPVNGPEVDGVMAGAPSGVAWFTASGDRPRVHAMAHAVGEGDALGSSVVVDAEDPQGRIDLARDPEGGLWVSWLATDGEEAVVSLRTIEPDGAQGEIVELGRTSTRRASGVPRLEAFSGGLLALWLHEDEGAEEDAGSPRLRAARILVEG